VSIEEAIYTVLTEDGGVSDLVDDRVYPDFVPTGESYPAVTYKLVAGHDDVSTDDATLPTDRWQITAWALTHEDCIALYAALRDLWARFGGSFAGVDILETWIVQRGDIPTLNEDKSDVARWGKFLDVMISYKE
jgi:hypothetical protein